MVKVRRQGHPARQLADAVRRVHAGLRVVDPALAMDSPGRRVNPRTERERDVPRVALEGVLVAEVIARVHLYGDTIRDYLSSAIGKNSTSTRMEPRLVAWSRGWI